MELALWQYGALVLAGTIGGLINVMAAGGSMITVPIMVLMGLPGSVANGTNRVAIFAQNLTAIGTFHRRGISNFKLSLSLGACAIPGAAIGAWIGTQIRGDLFNIVLAVIMLAVMVLMQTGGAKSKAGNGSEAKNLLAGHLLMVAVGFWGGFIHIGVGFLIMPVLNRVMGLDLVTTNAYKAFIVNVYTVVALGIFAFHSDVLWLVGGVLALGNSLGGYLGAKLTITKGEPLILKVLFIAIVVMIIRLLFF